MDQDEAKPSYTGIFELKEVLRNSEVQMQPVPQEEP